MTRAADPIRNALMQGPARDLVDGHLQMGSVVMIPIGAAALTEAAGTPRTVVLAVAATPPGSLAPLFAAVRDGTFEGESATWAAADLDANLEATYAYLLIFTHVAAARSVLLVIDAINMWRGFLFSDEPPDLLLLADGDDERIELMMSGELPPSVLDELVLVPVPNPPLPFGGLRAQWGDA